MPPSDPSDVPAEKSALPVSRRRSELTRQVLEIQLGSDVGELRHVIARGAHWFYWVAGLSLVNSLIALAGMHFVFLAGLAVSQIVDVLATHLGSFAPYFSVTIDVVVAVLLCGFGYLASHGSRAALITGMILYALDGAIFLYLSAYLSAAFHAYVLYQIGRGWKARSQLDRLRSSSSTVALAEAEGRTLEQMPFR